jgi:hypothetical protein
MAQEPPRPVDVLRRVLPTARHAQALFQMVVDRLGERAVVLTSGGEQNRVLYVRSGGEGSFLFPWPLLRLTVQDPPPGGPAPEDERVIYLDEVDDHEPWRGQLKLYDGALALSVPYGRDGRSRDGSGPAEEDAFEGLVPALDRGSDNRLELLAEYVAGLDVGRHGPARVIFPRPTPGGVEGAWAVGRKAIREAMASRRVPPGSFWAVADGYVGSALAFGTSRDDALATWRKEVERLHPKPPPPPERSDFVPPEGAIVMRSRGFDAPPFDPSPDAVPAAAVRVAALPAEKPAHGAWTRWLGDRGATQFAVRLPIEGGYTIVGEALLSLVDLTTLDAALDALDAARPALPMDVRSAPPTHATLYYRCIDLATGLPIEPRIENSDYGTAFDPAGFDGNRLRTHVVRMRVLE